MNGIVEAQTMVGVNKDNLTIVAIGHFEEYVDCYGYTTTQPYVEFYNISPN